MPNIGLLDQAYERQNKGGFKNILLELLPMLLAGGAGAALGGGQGFGTALSGYTDTSLLLKRLKEEKRQREEESELRRSAAERESERGRETARYREKRLELEGRKLGKEKEPSLSETTDKDVLGAYAQEKYGPQATVEMLSAAERKEARDKAAISRAVAIAKGSRNEKSDKFQRVDIDLEGKKLPALINMDTGEVTYQGRKIESPVGWKPETDQMIQLIRELAVKEKRQSMAERPGKEARGEAEKAFEAAYRIVRSDPRNAGLTDKQIAEKARQMMPLMQDIFSGKEGRLPPLSPLPAHEKQAQPNIPKAILNAAKPGDRLQAPDGTIYIKRADGTVEKVK